MAATPQLHIVAELQLHGLQAVLQTYKLTAHRHPKHRQLVQLKYHQHSSPFEQPAARGCRGVVLDEADGWRPVAYPYPKFFNDRERQHKTVLDWRSAVVYEKLDGSLATLYHYGGEWHVASAGRPDGGGWLFGTHSFRDLFWEVWAALEYQLPDDRDFCYMFELCSPRHPIICQIREERIVLHGARHMGTLAEAAPRPVADRHGWQCVRTFPLRKMETVRAAAKELDPTADEGFVVVDKHWQRLKVKAPGYAALCHLQNSDGYFQDYRILQVIRRGEEGEFLAYFPDLKGLLAPLAERYAAFCARHDAAAADLRGQHPECGAWSRDRVQEWVAAAAAHEGVALAVLHPLLREGGTARDVAHCEDRIPTENLWQWVRRERTKKERKRERQKAAAQAACPVSDPASGPGPAPPPPAVDPPREGGPGPTLEPRAPAVDGRRARHRAADEGVSMQELDRLLGQFQATGRREGRGKGIQRR